MIGAFIRKKPERTVRNMLVELGIGQFNTTQIIPFLFTQPATTDPKQAGIILLVKAIQQNLNAMGATLRENGYLDLPTAAALNIVVGDRWETLTWNDNVSAILSARKNKLSIAPVASPAMGSDIHAAYQEMGLFGLPDVPGGILTYAVGAYFLYRYLKKRKKG